MHSLIARWASSLLEAQSEPSARNRVPIWVAATLDYYRQGLVDPAFHARCFRSAKTINYTATCISGMVSLSSQLLASAVQTTWRLQYNAPWIEFVVFAVGHVEVLGLPIAGNL